MIPIFKFLEVKNYLASGLSLDGWCRVNRCAMHKLVFPYEWLHHYDKLSHMGPVGYENFYSKLKGGFTISSEKYIEFVQKFHTRGCMMMMDWLRVYNEADVISFIEALDKTRNQYYPDEIDMIKDAVSIPRISMTRAKQSSQDEIPWRSRLILPRSTLQSYLQQILQWNRL